MNASHDVRTEIYAAGLKQWQIAERLGINDANFSRKLRKELSADQKTKIRATIEDMKGEK